MVLIVAFLTAGLVVAGDQELFAKAGIVGHCKVVPAPVGERAEWRRCEEGLITGYPNLSLDSCSRAARTSTYEYWRCPPRTGRSASRT
jgi:hypothetical protein